MQFYDVAEAHNLWQARVDESRINAFHCGIPRYFPFLPDRPSAIF